jgi:uncharacterized protein involved in exopolysaccharide biosynthesis/Mrp family chromosome partitioning ATPase
MSGLALRPEGWEDGRPGGRTTSLAPATPVAEPFLGHPYGAPQPNRLVWAELLVTAWARRGLLLLAFALPVLGALAFALLGPRDWRAEGAFLVQVTRESLGASDLSGFGPSVQSVEQLKVVRSEVEIIGSDQVARHALLRIGIDRLFPGLGARRWPWQAPLEEGDRLALASEVLRRNLRTETDPGSNVVRVSLDFGDRALALETLTALVEAYQQRRTEMFSETGAGILGADLARYGTQLREIEAEIQAVKQRHAVLDIAQDLQLAGARLASVEQRESALRELRAGSLAQLAAAQSRLTAQPQRVLAAREATNLAPNDEARNTLLQLMLERERMAAQYAADWPGLRELDRRIASARASAENNARQAFTTTREVRNPSVELLSTRVVTLQVETEAVQRQLDELAAQRTEAQRRSAILLRAEAELRDLQRQRDGLEVVYRQFTSREAGARVDEGARRAGSANVTVVQPPTVPLNPRTGRLLVVAAGLAVGLLGAAAAAVLLTVNRRTFASSEEAARGLSLPTLAAFPSLDRAARDLAEDGDVVEFAAMLLDARIDRQRLQVVQFVSAEPEDGRADLARTLAVELARGRAQETLLIDLQTDGRAHLAALGSQPLAVERTEGHVIAFNTVIPTLWIAYDARRSHLADPRVAESDTRRLLHMLKQEFSVIVIIGPDPSESYAARRLAALVDGNVVVVRGGRTRGAPARRSRDSILVSGGPLLGLAFTDRRPVLPPLLARLA